MARLLSLLSPHRHIHSGTNTLTQTDTDTDYYMHTIYTCTEAIAPLIVRGTDIETAAERESLLADRTSDERVRRYLLTGRKRKKPNRKKAKVDGGAP